MMRLHGLLLGLSIATSAAVLALPARAQPSAAAPSAADLARARSLFEAGGRAYDKGQFDVALQAFEQAYAIVPKDGLLFSVAQSHRRLFTATREASHRDAALAGYRLYLERVKSGGRRAEAMAALGELESTAGAPAPAPGPSSPPAPAAPPTKKTRLYVSSATPGVTVTIDGRASEANVALDVAPGKHRIQLSAEGHVAKEVPIEAIEGELVAISQDLEEKPARLTLLTDDGTELAVDGRFVGEAPLGAALSLPAGRHFVTAQRAGRRTRAEVVTLERGKSVELDFGLSTTVQRDLSFVVMGVGGAAMIAGGVLGGISFVRQSDALDVEALRQRGNISEQQLDDYEAARADRDMFRAAAVVTAGSGVLVSVVGVGMFLLDPPERPTAPMDAESPAPEKAPAKPGPSMDELMSFVPAVGPDLAMGTFVLRF